jgi:hypothetical protein
VSKFGRERVDSFVGVRGRRSESQKEIRRIILGEEWISRS